MTESGDELALLRETLHAQIALYTRLEALEVEDRDGQHWLRDLQEQTATRDRLLKQIDILGRKMADMDHRVLHQAMADPGIHPLIVEFQRLIERTQETTQQAIERTEQAMSQRQEALQNQRLANTTRRIRPRKHQSGQRIDTIG